MQYFISTFSQSTLLAFCLLGVFSITIYNISGVTVTKYINALARSICDVTRTILIWAVGIIVTLTAGSVYPNYKWEIVDGLSIGLQLIGFVILIIGNLIYNNIIEFPFF